jgi:hypothetical protein
MLAGTLSGTVIQVRRFGRNPVVRGRAAATATSLEDILRPAIIRSASDVRSAAPAAPATPAGGGCTDCG